MAEGAAVSFNLESIRDLVINDKVKAQVERLQMELNRMRSFLTHAEAENVDKEKIREWVAEFREFVYDAEDLIESYAFKIGSRKQHRSGITGSIRRGVSCLSVASQTHKVGVQIDALLIKIADLNKSLKEYGILEILEAKNEVGSTKTKLRRAYSHVVEKDFVGLESDVEKLVNHLVADTHKIVSIFGMGGLGKTTLAQKIYSHQRVRGHFQAHGWVCISKVWKKSDILKSILLKIEETRREEIVKLTEEDELVRELYKAQTGRKCLFVLDDIWGTDAWDSIKPAFHENSTVLLTTRNREVALKIGPRGFHHEPRLLNEEESWDLLQRKAFLNSETAKDMMNSKDNDEALGWKMVRHCGGLPLALIVLGGILATKCSLEEWRIVHENIKNAKGISHYQDRALNEILSLSYENLPYRLKACFLYMAGFPEDESIDAENLYNLWMAEGLVSVEDRNGDEMLICVAERYLGELAQRSMVQVQSRRFSSVLKFKSCCLHDIMRDLSLKKAREENFLHVVDESTSYPSSSFSTCKMRRVRISMNNIHDNQHWPPLRRMMKNTRSLQLCFKDKGGGSQWIETDFNKFQLLRSLFIETDFNDFQLMRSLVIEGNPSSDYYYHPAISVRNLSHLRYLCASDVYHFSLRSLSKLEHLQTLDLRDIEFWKTRSTVLKNQTKLKNLHLPSEKVNLCKKMLRFDSLRELERLSNFDPYYCEVKDMSKLTKLREVSIMLGKPYRGSLDKGVNCIEDVINSLNNLKFLDHLFLCIWGRKSFEGDRVFLSSTQKSLDEDSSHAFVRALKQLFFDSSSTFGRALKPLNLGSSSTFVRALKRLTLHFGEIDNGFVVALEKLPNLRQLELQGCRGISGLICDSSNGFPQLKFLTLIGLEDMKNWWVEKGGMPNLSHLQIQGCEKLKKFPEGLNIKSLQEIKYYEMPKEFCDDVKRVSGQQGANFKIV